MSILTPQNASRAIGIGRIAFGAALIAVPDKVGQAWLGEGGKTAPTQVALRGVGIRDAVIGMAQIHTAGDPERGYRWARTSSFGDLVDVAATLGGAKLLPRSGVVGTVALGGATAVLSILASEWMRRSA
jgi:hypothetical protein